MVGGFVSKTRGAGLTHRLKRMSFFPPRHICIAGALMIAVGVGSIIGMIAKLRGGFHFDFGFVAIPIGYGVLIGRASSARWGMIFSLAGVLLYSGFGGWTLWKHFRGSERLFYPDSAYFAVGLVISIVCCLYVFLVLIRRGHREWFGNETVETGPVKTFAWSVAMAATVLLVSRHALEWRTAENHRRMYGFRVKVTPFNAEDGKGVQSIIQEGGFTSFSNGDEPAFPRVQTYVLGGDDGMHLVFSGVATEPFEVTIRSEGFKPKRIRLDQDTEDEIRVALTPLQ